MVLSDVSFEVEQGRIVGVMGANGAGKTMLFGLIAGNLRPSAGDIVFEGRSLRVDIAQERRSGGGGGGGGGGDRDRGGGGGFGGGGRGRGR